MYCTPMQRRKIVSFALPIASSTIISAKTLGIEKQLRPDRFLLMTSHIHYDWNVHWKLCGMCLQAVS